MMNDFLQGHVLVASPHLPDTNFYRSVVLLVQHNEDGAFGLVLNRPLEQTVGEIWELIADSPCASRQPINLGGPVDGQLMALHTDPAHNSREVIPGVYFSIEPDELEEIVENQAGPYLLFSGYSGWGPGQLEDELEAGGWLTALADKELVFANQETMWKVVSSRIGLDILAPVLRCAAAPDDPSCN